MTFSELCRPVAGIFLIVLFIAGEWLLRVRHRRSAMHECEEGLRAWTQCIEPETIAGHFRIVALGDSITHGMALRREQTYPEILSNLLQSHYEQPVMVINAGIAGQTALQGLQRVWRDVIRYQPHITLIAFGLNDASLRRRQQDAFREHDLGPAMMNRLHTYRTCRTRIRQIAVSLGLRESLNYDAAPQNEPRASSHAYRAALRQLVKQIRRHSSGEVWLITMHPARQDNSLSKIGERQHAIRREYNEIVREVAGELDAGLIDIERMFTEKRLADVWQADGIHLTEAGQRHLAESIYGSLTTHAARRRGARS